MKIKEAIENVETAFGAWASEYAVGKKENDNIEKEMNEVITLLQQGEKYKQIVNSIEWHINTCKEVDPEVYGWLKFIKRIIQKYFPKEVKDSGQ